MCNFNVYYNNNEGVALKILPHKTSVFQEKTAFDCNEKKNRFRLNVLMDSQSRINRMQNFNRDYTNMTI